MLGALVVALQQPLTLNQQQINFERVKCVCPSCSCSCSARRKDKGQRQRVFEILSTHSGGDNAKKMASVEIGVAAHSPSATDCKPFVGLSGAVPMSSAAQLEEQKPLQGGDAMMSIDEAIERIGETRFHLLAAVILGIANAADATELLSIGYILPQLEDINDQLKGARAKSATGSTVV